MFTVTSVSNRPAANVKQNNCPQRKTTVATQPVFSGKNGNIEPNDLDEVMLSIYNANHLSYIKPLNIISDVASSTSNSEVMEYLAQAVIKSENNIDAPIVHVNQAPLLQRAIIGGRPEMVEIVLRKGANPLQTDKFGKTALDLLDKITAQVIAKERTDMSEKDCRDIQALLTRRLAKMAQEKTEKDAARSGSSWSFWPFGGGSAQAKEVVQKAPKMVSAEAQTEPIALSSDRERELLTELDALRLSVKTTQKQLSENASKLDKKENRLKEAIDKNDQLQKQLSPLKKENGSLQSRLQRELESARSQKNDFDSLLSRNAETAKRTEEIRQAEIASLKAENSRIQQLLDEQGRTASGEKSRLEQALAAALKEKDEKSRLLDERGRTASSEQNRLREALTKALKEKDEKGQSLEEAQQGSKEQLKTLREENQKLQKALGEQDQKAQAKLSESEQSRIKIQEDAQAQSLKQKEDNYRLQKELIEQTQQSKDLQVKLKVQEETLERETAAFKKNLQEAGEQSNQYHSKWAGAERKLEVLWHENQTMNQQAARLNLRIQSLEEALEARTQIETQKTLELRAQLIEEKKARLATLTENVERQERLKQANSKLLQDNSRLFADNREFLSRLGQLRQERQSMNERLGAAEGSKGELLTQMYDQQCRMNALLKDWNVFQAQFQRKAAELAQAQRQQGLFSRIIGELMGQSSKQKLETQRQNAAPYPIENVVQVAEQSSDLEEILKQVARQRGQEHQKTLQEQTGRALESTSLSGLDVVNKLDQDYRPKRSPDKDLQSLRRTKSLA